tara:strand:- start:377 stop:664 length:288 start_codon:yes stop_codon:yes gene_type:complete
MPIKNVFNDEGGTGIEVGAQTAQTTQIDDFTTLTNNEKVRFTTTKDVTTGSLNVYLNGLRQRSAQISIIDDRNFEFSQAPQTGDTLEAVYLTPSE